LPFQRDGHPGCLAPQCPFADGVADFHDYRDEDGSEHASLYKDVIEHIHHRPSACHSVSIRHLDGLAAELGVTRIHLLKVDTEGHELAVLHGAERLIRSGSVDIMSCLYVMII